jgi:hypothetical protein
MMTARLSDLQNICLEDKTVFMKRFGADDSELNGLMGRRRDLEDQFEASLAAALAPIVVADVRHRIGPPIS